MFNVLSILYRSIAVSEDVVLKDVMYLSVVRFKKKKKHLSQNTTEFNPHSQPVSHWQIQIKAATFLQSAIVGHRAILWSSIIPRLLLTLQGAHCVLVSEWRLRHWTPVAFKCPTPVQSYSMPSCLPLGSHFASNGGEATEDSSVIVIYNFAYLILQCWQAIHCREIHMWVSTCLPSIGLVSCGIFCKLGRLRNGLSALRTPPASCSCKTTTVITTAVLIAEERMLKCWVVFNVHSWH